MSAFIAKRFGLLLGTTLVGTLALALVVILVFTRTGVHGSFQRDISDAQDLISDIEPPPMYLVETMLVARQLPATADPLPLIERRGDRPAAEAAFATPRAAVLHLMALLEGHRQRTEQEAAASNASGPSASSAPSAPCASPPAASTSCAPPHARIARAGDPPAQPDEGLGLTRVVSCITAHRGHLLLDSAPGAGSTFRILLPPAGTAATAAA